MRGMGKKAGRENGWPRGGAHPLLCLACFAALFSLDKDDGQRIRSGGRQRQTWAEVHHSARARRSSSLPPHTHTHTTRSVSQAAASKGIKVYLVFFHVYPPCVSSPSSLYSTAGPHAHTHTQHHLPPFPSSSSSPTPQAALVAVTHTHSLLPCGPHRLSSIRLAPSSPIELHYRPQQSTGKDEGSGECETEVRGTLGEEERCRDQEHD